MADPKELAQKLHNRLTEIQSNLDNNRKYLTWEDLLSESMKGKYDSYMEGFILAVKELVTDKFMEIIPIPKMEMKISKVDPDTLIRRLVKSCYACSSKFNPIQDEYLCPDCK